MQLLLQQSQNTEKPNNLKDFGNKNTKVLSRITSKSDKGLLFLREMNLTLKSN